MSVLHFTDVSFRHSIISKRSFYRTKASQHQYVHQRLSRAFVCNNEIITCVITALNLLPEQQQN